MSAPSNALEAVIDLPPVAESVPAARHIVAPLLAAWATESLADDTALLLLSELVTNVVRHVPGPTRLRIQIHLDGSVLHISVSDTSTTHPILGTLAAGNGGHGIQLVARLAHRWGIANHEAGKRVWFELLLGAHTPQRR